MGAGAICLRFVKYARVPPEDLRAARANRVFCADEKRIRTEKTVMVQTRTGRGLIQDRRLRADEKHIRTQSAILHKDNPKPGLFLIHNRVFCADALFIRAESTVGARSAQWSPLAYRGIEMPHFELK